MKHWNLLIWVPQFGISVVFPLILFIMLAVWLRERWGWGSWVIAAGVICGLITAAIGFRDTARAMLEASGHKDGKDEKPQDPGVSFNSHD